MESKDRESKAHIVEARARNISHNVRCTECGSQSIEDAQADTAILLSKISLIIAVAREGTEPCTQACGNNRVPYPFGFSPNCPIFLNCSSDHEMFISDFPLKSIDSDMLMIRVVVNCSRPLQALRSLFTKNYAPSSENAVLLHNCSAPASVCIIPSTNMNTAGGFRSGNCSRNVSCFSQESVYGLMDYNMVSVKTQCSYLLSSISLGAHSHSSSSAEFGVMKLAWWLPGNCSCSRHANCYQIMMPGGIGHRCQCVDGFVGDGFRSGTPCKKGSSRERSNVPLPTSTRKRLAVPLSTSIIGSAVFILFIVYMFVKCKREFNSRKKKERDDNEEQGWEAMLLAAVKWQRKFSFQDLKQATDDFRLKLGAGGFGSVFSGTLSDGTRIAVKRLDRSGQGKGEFLAEVKSIGSIHHRNLVKLLGFCVENSQRLLVYEYMSNGSLDRWIFNTDSGTSLEWRIKKNLILDIARGLAYLHNECENRIAHLDVKPQNILLDSEFCAKLSDFGLARLIERNRSQVTTQMRGTPGYMAPEWLTGRITEKVDVYSFGVVMLETVCGRKKYDTSMEREDNYNLLSVVKQKAEESRLIDLVHKRDVDTDIIEEEDEEEEIEMIKLAIWCLHKDPNKRPSMLEVVKFVGGEVKMEMEVESDYSFLSFHPVEAPTEVVLVASGSDTQPASILSGPR